MKNACYLILIVVLAACAPAGEFQGRKNPKPAEVEIQNEVVTIRLPASSAYFWLDKVRDESVPYNEIFFKYEPEEERFYFRTDLDDWQPVPPAGQTIEMGLVEIVMEDRVITITYPSGTWAFP
jgi:hypothetical protein